MTADAANRTYAHLNSVPVLGSKADLQITAVVRQYAWLQILYETPSFTRGYALYCDNLAGTGSTYTIWVPGPSVADAFLARYARGAYMPCLWPDDEFELPRETPNPRLNSVEGAK